MISLTVVTLTNFFSFSQNEQKSSDILNRLDSRKKLNHLSQEIIYYTFKIKEIVDKKENRTIQDDNLFCKFLRILNLRKREAFKLKEDIESSTFASDIDKIDEISVNLNSILDKIYENLKPIRQIKRKIKFQIEKMKILQKNVEDCLGYVKLK